MGQSINVLLYGCITPDGVDVSKLREKWEQVASSKIQAYEARLSRRRGHQSYSLARQAYVPESPCPDDAQPDPLIGFYVCQGDYDSASSHRLPALTFAEMRRQEPTAQILKRCRRRWFRFARWAKGQGVELGRARIWRTRTDVA